jgi:hypothetical protein
LRFVPFDGERTLDVVLSKTVLLADDDKITNKAILGQFD